MRITVRSPDAIDWTVNGLQSQTGAQSQAESGAPSFVECPENDLAPILAIRPRQTEHGEDAVNLKIPFHSVLCLQELANSERMSPPKETSEAERLLAV
jgi:hypothetical protein